MTQGIAEHTTTKTDLFPVEQVKEWRRQVLKQREVLFRQNWKNMRQVVRLKSRVEEANFQFVVEWYDEFGDVVGRQKERNRLDKLLALGLDVNAPREELPDV